MVVASGVPDLATDHPFLDAGLQELVSIWIIGLHGTIICTQEDLVKSLVVQDGRKTDRCKV